METKALIYLLKLEELNIKILFLMLLFSPLLLFSQIDKTSVNIEFDTIAAKYTKGGKDQIIPIKLKINQIKIDHPENYSLAVEVDQMNSTLSSGEYSFSYRKTLLSKLGQEEKLYLTINKDTLPDRERTIVLNVKCYENASGNEFPNIGTNKKMTITVEPSDQKPKSNGYEYLAYVGTNFDLVEGIQAKDLFFATNIYKSPEHTDKKKVGFYLSIYGNRAFSQIDSSGTINRIVSIDSLTQDSYRVVRERRKIRNERSTDNLGAYISPLIKMNFLNSPSSDLKLYYSPSLEFVYRRTRSKIDYLGESSLDSITISGDINDFPGRVQNLPESKSISYNEYSFNLGLVGLFLSLENERISVRVHGSVGYSSNYFADFDNGFGNSVALKHSSDVFFTGRAWITEPVSGLTLQAEVTNSLINPRPFFVATLSKAFDFKDLGSIFSPISSR